MREDEDNPLVSWRAWRRIVRELEGIVRLYDYGEFYLVRDERGRLRWTGLSVAEVERDSPGNEVVIFGLNIMAAGISLTLIFINAWEILAGYC